MSSCRHPSLASLRSLLLALSQRCWPFFFILNRIGSQPSPFVGLTLSVLCFTFFSLREDLGRAYKPLVALVVSLLVTFSRGSSPRVASVSDVLSTIPFLTKWFNLEECSECKI
jgi:hypothetical protein